MERTLIMMRCGNALQCPSRGCCGQHAKTKEHRLVVEQPQYWAELDGFFASGRQTKALKPANTVSSETDDEQLQPPCKEQCIASPDGLKAPAAQSTTNSKHVNELASHMPDGAKGLATGLQAVPKMGPLPTIHQLVLPMAQGTRVIGFKLVDYHHARRRGWVVQVQCPLCNALIHQRLDEVEQGQELPAARAHLQRTIGNKHQSFRLATAGTSVTRNEGSCSGAYHNWCRVLLREGHDPQSHDHQGRYTKGREICVPLYSDAFQWGYESWRNEDVPVLDICSYLSVPRTQKAKEAGLPTTPAKAETCAAGVATQVCSPASPSTPKWALTPDASSPSPAAALPGAVSSPAKPNFRNMHLSPTKVQHLKQWQHVSPTPYCSCAQRRYKGDGVYLVVKVHDVDCECYTDPNEGWPAQMHWELERLPKRIQPK